MLDKRDRTSEQVEIVCMEERVPKDYLLRKINNAIDFSHIYDFVNEIHTVSGGLAQVSNWFKLKYAAMNLKKLAIWRFNSLFIFLKYLLLNFLYGTNPAFIN